MNLQDEPLDNQPDAQAIATDPPVQATTDPPKQDPATELAIERARNEAYREAIQSFGPRPPQDDPTRPAPINLPDNPLDLLNAQQRQELSDLALTNPDEHAKRVSGLSMKLAEARMAQATGPLVASNAQLLVEAFKGRRGRIDGALAAQIEPIFDSLLRGIDLRPLVNMNDAQRDQELGLRWEAAKSRVLEQQMRTTARQEPRLLAGDAIGGPKQSAFNDDPFIASMKQRYNLTDDQIKALQEVDA